MAKTCNGCSTDMPSVTFSAMSYEEHENRHERRERRLWIALIVAIAMILLSNLAWMIYESTFDTYYCEQDGYGINNFNSGEQGDLNNVAEDKMETQEGQE